MTEAEEIAKQQQDAYKRHLQRIGFNSRLCLAREFVQWYVSPRESVAVIDNIAAALHKGETK